VEARGIEPLSEGVPTKASTSVSLGFDFALQNSQGQDLLQSQPLDFFSFTGAIKENSLLIMTP